MTDSHPSSDRHTISSSLFNYNGIDVSIEDNGEGVLRLVQPIGDMHKKIRDVGTVNYDTGLIKLINFTVNSYQGNEIKIYARPRDSDVSVNKNTILTIEPTEIKVKIEAVRV